jgi:hypothetical protein
MELAFTSASDHHFACTTRLEHQLSVPPANIEDEALIGHGPIMAQSSDVHTVGVQYIYKPGQPALLTMLLVAGNVVLLEPHIAHVCGSTNDQSHDRHQQRVEIQYH